jgi:hypothetical protein
MKDYINSDPTTEIEPEFLSPEARDIREMNDQINSETNELPF